MMQNNTSSMMKLWLTGAGIVVLLLVGWASTQAQQRSKQKKAQQANQSEPKKQADVKKNDDPNARRGMGIPTY